MSVDLNSWIEGVKHLLKPPVGNKLLYGSGQLKVQVVGGPNRREDFHINEGSEIFIMMKGDMQVNIMECGQRREIPILEGQIFVLPGCIPHSPQRLENTIGIVIERERKSEETDGLRWYVPGTNKTLFEDWFHCTDLGTQLKPVIEAYFASEEYKTKIPTKTFGSSPVTLDMTSKPADPVYLKDIFPDVGCEGKYLYDGEFSIFAATEKSSSSNAEVSSGEILFWQMKGSSTINVIDIASGTATIVAVPEEHVYLLPAGSKYTTKYHPGSICLVISNKIVDVPSIRSEEKKE